MGDTHVDSDSDEDFDLGDSNDENFDTSMREGNLGICDKSLILTPFANEEGASKSLKAYQLMSALGID